MNRSASFPLEGIIWITALVVLFFYTPGTDPHLTLCPLSLAGIESCPGCGLGRSIALALKADLAASFEYHVLGIPALGILVFRIYQLTVQFITDNYGKSNGITS